MGGIFSTPSTPNPSDSHNSPAMSSSHSPQNAETQPESVTSNSTKDQENIILVQESSDPLTNLKASDDKEKTFESSDGNEAIEEDEEEGECGFCLFMKGGGCRDAFISWEKCVEAGEKNDDDIVEKCVDVTAKLRECMLAHSDYYAPILQAEKAAEEEASRELEKEKEIEKAKEATEEIRKDD